MKEKLKLAAVLLTFGSISLFVKEVNLSSSKVALLRAVIGTAFLGLTMLVLRKKTPLPVLRQNFLRLFFCGIGIGFNWILLFEAYHYTTVSVATISYYFAPVFVMALSPLLLKERLTPLKVGCLVAAMAGLFLVVNIGSLSGSSSRHLIGVVCGLSSAAFYAGVILINKFFKGLSGLEMTFYQLAMATVILAVYVGVREGFSFAGLDSKGIISILIVGIVHTGIGYVIYFTAVSRLRGQTVAVLSYIDPISAVLFSAIFLKERMTLLQVLGGILILGSTFLSEWMETRREGKVPVTVTPDGPES